ncbi:MAG: thiamine phosphate synthase [Bacillota bacterium]
MTHADRMQVDWWERLGDVLSLYVVTDESLQRGRSEEEVALAAFAGGAGAVQLRCKKESTRSFIQKALRVKDVARRSGGLLIINDRLDVAMAVDADGLHIGQDDMPLELVRKLWDPKKIVGVSVSTAEEARLAEKEGADYLGAGAIMSTPTKTDVEVIGLDGLRRICDAVKIPVVGIGGIGVSNAGAVIGAGAAGVAVVSAVVSAEDVTASAREILREVQLAKERRG